MNASLNFSRCQFVNSSLYTGYALATLPILASAISTPSQNLETGDIQIGLGKETVPAYFARPKKEGKFPSILVVHEVFGVHEYIRDICRRLALQGYYAMTVDLYARYGDATKMTDFDEIRKKIVSKASLNQIFSDLDAGYHYLCKDKKADAKRIGITGFCWGGIVTWLYAEHNPQLKAGVSWYGRLQGEHTANFPKFPLDIAETLNVPVLGLYGEKDESIPLTLVQSMNEKLKKGKTGSHIIVYPNVGHAFHADYRPTYNKDAAEKGWNTMLTWFKDKGL